MKSETPSEKSIFWNYITQELEQKSNLVDYIVTQNLRKLIQMGTPKSNEEYRGLLQELFSEYQVSSFQKDKTPVVKNPPLNKYITLNNQQVLTIKNANIIQYKFMENDQIIFSNTSAQAIYTDIIKYLFNTGHTSIIHKKYLKILTAEEWKQKLINSFDKYIKNKYQNLDNDDKYMIFISIVPSDIMKKLITLFIDLDINLDSFKIYLQNDVNDDILVDNKLTTAINIRAVGQPDLIYDPQNLELFYAHEEEFKRELLKYKRAKKITYKTDNTIDEQIWNASNLTADSDLKINITTNHLIRGYIKYDILSRIEFFIIR